MKMFHKIIVLCCLCACSLQAISQQITASYTANASAGSFTGRVFLYLSKDAVSPKDGMIGIEKFPCFFISVKDVKPGQKVVFNDAAVFYPVALSEIERGSYHVQVVWDRNGGGASIGDSPGNMYNGPMVIKFGKDTRQTFNVVCAKVIGEQSFTETQFVKELKAPSALLTAFYKRPATVNAAVILPKEYYDQPLRKFPVLYWVSGFGGDYHAYSGKNDPGLPIDTTACIRVYLDGRCPGGHSVYANSENNGPWGDALTTELIPLVEKNYRTNAARLLTGHSSGGWTVLWLQTHYPKVFTACWSSSPDPVDFRSFQEIDLYKDNNMFYAKDSSLRVAGTIAGRFPWIMMKTMYNMEHVLYRGGQMHSFNYVFSAKKADGRPRELCDEASGSIDSGTVAQWKKYDISLYLKTNWQQLKNDLQGKIRVSVGNQDNFLLNYAVVLLEKEMKTKDAGFEFAYYPGDHFTVSTPEYRTSGYRFLQQKYQELNLKK